ncbi:sugar phosphate isomerase/epimerase family protein [Kushneria phosphatilytica]|uniref:Sugar phosphate isomerase/epimerase n=1 Tax=Kushneria phosphatilytica TaxID=657387 RepID=A0A5C1A281_9GAMM|nr:sugar phosphate isomerase/epimerase family protein [Kushneria phosphatilytica]QEL12318.1 sugar phosphate isomerase/epimerase [Kushneria phosphatilytica]
MAPQTSNAKLAEALGLSVSTAAWDGYELPEALASMARLGITGVEIAYIRGYVNEFTDSDLNTALARELRHEMARHGQHCRVLSAHIDLGEPGALESFAVRVRFAAELGADYLITNAASRAGSDRFFANADAMADLAREAGVRVCLENPGDGSDNLLDRAADLPAVLERLDRAVFGINYDPGNLVSHRPALEPVEDALEAVALSDHFHLKAVHRDTEGYRFAPMGQGDIDYVPILAAIAKRRLPFSLELPFRLRRDSHAQPWKGSAPLALETIEQGVTDSLQWLRAHYPGLQSL